MSVIFHNQNHYIVKNQSFKPTIFTHKFRKALQIHILIGNNKLSAITNDGAVIDGFDPDTYEYSIEAEELGEILAETEVSGDDRIRKYPKGHLYSHIIGYCSKVYGKSQLEMKYDKELLGFNEPVLFNF